MAAQAAGPEVGVELAVFLEGYFGRNGRSTSPSRIVSEAPHEPVDRIADYLGPQPWASFNVPLAPRECGQQAGTDEIDLDKVQAARKDPEIPLPSSPVKRSPAPSRGPAGPEKLLHVAQLQLERGDRRKPAWVAASAATPLTCTTMAQALDQQPNHLRHLLLVEFVGHDQLHELAYGVAQGAAPGKTKEHGPSAGAERHREPSRTKRAGPRAAGGKHRGKRGQLVHFYG